MKENGKDNQFWQFQVRSNIIRGSNIKGNFLQDIRDHGRVTVEDEKTKKLQLENETKKATWITEVEVSDCFGQGI
jgi:hypothetical protein